mgnify:CR=1 FL=1
MAITKIQSESLNLADTYAFTGTVTGAGESNTPIVRVTKSSAQTISYNTYTTITFDVENIDTDNAFASNTFTVPSGKGGKYFISLQVISDDNFDATLERLAFLVNGSYQTSGNYFTGSGADESQISLNTILNLSAGDALTVTYFTYAGGNSSIKSNSDHNSATCLNIFKIAT